MTRDEMLEKLHNVSIAAQPTVITMDMGLEYEYITPDGYGDGFGGMGDWPVYQLLGGAIEQFTSIQQKIQDKTLTLDDLEGTDFLTMYQSVFSVERPAEYIAVPCEFFAQLVDISLSTDGVCYALCDGLDWQPEAEFFATYDAMAEAFVSRYVDNLYEWDDLDDEELANWVQWVEGYNGIQMITFQEEDAE